jgi:hypothetical protein
MKEGLDARRCLGGPHAGQAIWVLLVSFLLAAGMAAPAKAIVSESGPMELLLDAGAGRLYTYLAYENRILVLDIASGQLVKVITDVGIPGYRYEGTGIRTLALDEQIGRLFAINSAARGPEGQSWTLFAIDATQGTIVQEVLLGDPPSMPYSRMVADGAHGKLYAIAPEYTTVYDSATLAEQTTLPGGELEWLDRGSSRLYLANEETLTIVNLADDAVLAELPLPARFQWGIALDPSRGRLYVGLEDAIHVLDTTTQEWLDPLTTEPAPGVAMAVDPADGELYIVGPGGDGEQTTYHILALSPETGERKTTIDFPEPAACSGYPWISVSRLVADPRGGRIYGSGNAMSTCGPAAYLAFVLDTKAEGLLEWLPRLELPPTGGRPSDGGWLVWAGIGLLLSGLATKVLPRNKTCTGADDAGSPGGCRTDPDTAARFSP